MLRYDKIQFADGSVAYERRDEAGQFVDVVKLDGTPLDLGPDYAYCLIALGVKFE